MIDIQAMRQQQQEPSFQEWWDAQGYSVEAYKPARAAWNAMAEFYRSVSSATLPNAKINNLIGRLKRKIEQPTTHPTEDWLTLGTEALILLSEVGSSARGDRFVSVSDKLPTDDDMVVVRDADGQFAFDYFENGKWQNLCEDQGEPIEWYPLPKTQYVGEKK